MGICVPTAAHVAVPLVPYRAVRIALLQNVREKSMARAQNLPLSGFVLLRHLCPAPTKVLVHPPLDVGGTALGFEHRGTGSGVRGRVPDQCPEGVVVPLRHFGVIAFKRLLVPKCCCCRGYGGSVYNYRRCHNYKSFDNHRTSIYTAFSYRNLSECNLL